MDFRRELPASTGVVPDGCDRYNPPPLLLATSNSGSAIANTVGCVKNHKIIGDMIFVSAADVTFGCWLNQFNAPNP